MSGQITLSSPELSIWKAWSQLGDNGLLFSFPRTLGQKRMSWAVVHGAAAITHFLIFIFPNRGVLVDVEFPHDGNDVRKGRHVCKLLRM